MVVEDMKIKYDKRYFTYSFYIFLLVTALMFVYKTLDNIGGIIASIGTLLDSTFKLLTPFIIGFVVAYLLNPYVMWIETYIFGNKRSVFKSKQRRLLSILLVYFMVIGLITLAIIYIAPKVVNSIGDLINRIPEYFVQAEVFITEFLQKHELDKLYNISAYIEKYIISFMNRYDLQNIDVAISSLLKGVMNITTIFLHYILGFIIGFYLLMEKEGFIADLKRFLRALLKDETVEAWGEFAAQVNDIFSRFIIGKAIDSAIIGGLCFIGLMILNIKYALLISVIIGVTNMIPYFGPIIGGVPAVLITLFDDPVKALWLAVFILVLQQFDGMVLGPKILGNSIGLSPFWIIFAIIIGGGFFGIAGMFLGVPTIAVIRLLLLQFVDKRIQQKETTEI